MGRSAVSLTLSLTERQAEALRALAILDELPPEIYAVEVLVKHLYHAYTPEVARRAAEQQARLRSAGASEPGPAGES